MDSRGSQQQTLRESSHLVWRAGFILVYTIKRLELPFFWVGRLAKGVICKGWDRISGRNHIESLRARRSSAHSQNGSLSVGILSIDAMDREVGTVLCLIYMCPDSLQRYLPGYVRRMYSSTPAPGAMFQPCNKRMRFMYAMRGLPAYLAGENTMYARSTVRNCHKGSWKTGWLQSRDYDNKH